MSSLLNQQIVLFMFNNIFMRNSDKTLHISLILDSEHRSSSS